MKSVPNSRAMRRMQYAALPYRQRQDGEVQIRLITSRETRRWVIPKGWPMKGLTPAKAAAREAYEEAGLLGSISSEPLGLYAYDKRLALQTVPCDVMVFPLKVKRYLKKWPERSERFGFWFSIESAAAAVHEPDLGQLILDFGAMMAERFAQKRSRAPLAPSLAPSLVPADGEGLPGENLPGVAPAAAGAMDFDADGPPVKAAKRRLKIPPKGPSKRADKYARADGAAEPPDGAKAAKGKAAPGKVATGKAAAPKVAKAKAANPELVKPELAEPERAEGETDALPAAGPETAGEVAAKAKAAKAKAAKPKVSKPEETKAKGKPETAKAKAAKAKAKTAKPKAPKGKAQRAVPLEADEDAQGGWSAEDTRHLPQGLPFPPTRH
ncbi:NUDIX hydrolase [Azorhizobium doebereinerae]|uniref:NUDIX hydrolase n=1 Tax=Azorhizobium doebereinerae TaxID=281091 RepID=UPI00041A3797